MATVDHGQFFSREELQCRCGQFCDYACPMDSEFMKRLDDLREHFGKPLKVTSGYRCGRFIHLDDLTATETNNMRPWLWSY